MVVSPMHVESGDSSKKLYPEEGIGGVAGDSRLKEPAEPIVSHKDITKD